MAESKGAKTDSGTCSKVFVFTPPRFEVNVDALPKKGNSVNFYTTKLHLQFPIMTVYARKKE